MNSNNEAWKYLWLEFILLLVYEVKKSFANKCKRKEVERRIYQCVEVSEMVTLLCIMCGIGVCFHACSLYECLRVFKVSLIFFCSQWLLAETYQKLCHQSRQLKYTRNFAV